MLAVFIICCKKYRDYRKRNNRPKHLMDIWGDLDSEGHQPSFLPADKKVRHMERHLYVGAEGRKLGADWQDMVESGMMEAGDSWEVFTNPMFEQTDNEDEEEEGMRLWAFQATENGEFAFVNTTFLELAEDEPVREDMETTFAEVHNGSEGVDGGSKKGESSSEEGESEGEDSSGSGEKGSGSGDEESSEGEGDKSGSGGENEGTGSSGEESGDEEGKMSGYGSEEESEDTSSKEEEVSREGTEEDSTAEDTSSITALLPEAASIKEDKWSSAPMTQEMEDSNAEDTSPTTALLPEAATIKEEKWSSAPMTQEEMERAMQELHQAEQEIAGDTLAGWDDIENLLFNQWAEMQELEDGGHNLDL